MPLFIALISINTKASYKLEIYLSIFPVTYIYDNKDT